MAGSALQVAPSLATAGRVLAVRHDGSAFSSLQIPFVNVTDPEFGAVADGVTNNDAAFAAAIAHAQAYGKAVYVPGRFTLGDQSKYYKVNSTITLPRWISMFGDGIGSAIFGNNVSGPIISMTGGNGTQFLRDLYLAGSADTGVYINNAQQLLVSNISLAGISCTNGFDLSNCWDSTFANLQIHGATCSNAGILVQEAFNANICINWNASNSGLYNIKIDPTIAAFGNSLIAPACENGKWGLWVGRAIVLAIVSAYFENAAIPMQLGDYDAGKIASDVTILGLTVEGPLSDHTNYSSRRGAIMLDYVRGCDISCPKIHLTGNSKASFTASGGGGAGGLTGIVRVNRDGTLHSAEPLNPGDYDTAPTLTLTGGGTGSLTASLTGRKVTSITVADAGANNPALPVPVAVIYKYATRCTITSPHMDYGIGENDAPFYPWICRDAAAPGYAGVRVINDLSFKQGAQAPCDLIKGLADYVHVLEENDGEALGLKIQTRYTPPVFT